MRKSMCVCAISLATLVPAFADDLIKDKGEQWKVYNVKPATNSLWDINKAQPNGSGGLQFPIQPFDTQGTGSFAVYLLNNYNVDMTGKTITADVIWSPGTYETRSTTCAATPGYVRLEFQDVTSGPYNPNDYWWSTISLDLNTLTSGTLTASLAVPSLWTNLDGQSAVGNVGFTRAVKNVKQIGLSFGSACRYASGVAIDDTIPGTFQLQSFTVTGP